MSAVVNDVGVTVRKVDPISRTGDAKPTANCRAH